MARGENPGQVISIKTNLTHQKDIPYGHPGAGKDLAMGFNGSLVTTGQAILGKFLSLDKKKEASLDIGGHNGEPIIFRKTSASMSKGDLLIGGGQGKVASADKTALAEVAEARFRCLEVLETGDNGRILAIRA